MIVLLFNYFSLTQTFLNNFKGKVEKREKCCRSKMNFPGKVKRVCNSEIIRIYCADNFPPSSLPLGEAVIGVVVVH